MAAMVTKYRGQVSIIIIVIINILEIICKNTFVRAIVGSS